MKVIYKYELEHAGSQKIELPKGAIILDVQNQMSQGLRLWAIVDPDPKAEKEVRTIVIVGTGSQLGAIGRLIHINTFQQQQFVWHVFELKLD